jgi:hypothetical protein
VRFTKVARGWYATEDGRYAVVADGYEGSLSVGADVNYSRHSKAGGGYGGFQGGEWALVYDPAGGLRESHNAGTNVDWFPTKREAVEHGQYLYET